MYLSLHYQPLLSVMVNIQYVVALLKIPLKKEEYIYILKFRMLFEKFTFLKITLKKMQMKLKIVLLIPPCEMNKIKILKPEN